MSSTSIDQVHTYPTAVQHTTIASAEFFSRSTSRVLCQVIGIIGYPEHIGPIPPIIQPRLQGYNNSDDILHPNGFHYQKRRAYLLDSTSPRVTHTPCRVYTIYTCKDIRGPSHAHDIVGLYAVPCVSRHRILSSIRLQSLAYRCIFRTRESSDVFDDFFSEVPRHTPRTQRSSLTCMWYILLAYYMYVPRTCSRIPHRLSLLTMSTVVFPSRFSFEPRSNLFSCGDVF